MGLAAFIDPTRDRILSTAMPSDLFEIIDVSTLSAPRFFLHSLGLNPVEPFDPNMISSLGEDCSTGIAVASLGHAVPTGFDPEMLSTLYVADLMQSTFTPDPPPGSWTGPAQVQTLTESENNAYYNSVVMAQGTHQGAVSGIYTTELTAIQLPATSGNGTPAVTDWVTCMPFLQYNGSIPYVVNTYKSPNTGHAMATIINYNYYEMMVVDLTRMLDPIIVPRTSGPGLGHACAEGVLPSSVARVIEIP